VNECPVPTATDHRTLFNELTKAFMEKELLQPKRLWRAMKDRADFDGTLAGPQGAWVAKYPLVFGREMLVELMCEAMKLKRGETISAGGINVTKLTYKKAKNPELQVDILMPGRHRKSYRSFIMAVNPGSGQPLLMETHPTDFSWGHLFMPSLEARRK
jgi:hypothetical protein